MAQEGQQTASSSHTTSHTSSRTQASSTNEHPMPSPSRVLLRAASNSPSLHYVANAANHRLVQACPSLHAPQHPTQWMMGGNPHAQIVLHDRIKRWGVDTLSFRRQLLEHPDGGVTALDWYRSTETAEEEEKEEQKGKGGVPICMVLHTITGRTDDHYGLRTLLTALIDAGVRPVVHARRGCGNLSLATPRFNSLGCAEDTRLAVRSVLAAVETKGRQGATHQISLIGLSAGSGAMMRYLGEEGDAATDTIQCAVAVCPGYSVPAAWSRCHPFYSRVVTHKLKKHFMEPNEAVLRHVEGFAETKAAQTLASFHLASFRMSGFGSADEYDEATDPFRVSQHVKVPLLAINAKDDPLCVEENIRMDFFSSHPTSVLALTEKGGHLAFYQGAHLEPSCWADTAAVEWLKANAAAPGGQS